ncbi:MULTISPECIES: dephospho-CoA kinase [Methylomonas]|uniref:dephospho-CoA kinase n=1 Tax=Methylomonas TaxID=416 RepID=UPI0012327479|nr:dephospho-CoA kinase [Methylomonas rhizoryzae]
MLRVGLTGGIGSGKSYVCRLFAQLGATVIDADLVARELVKPGRPLLNSLVQLFGEGIILPNGELDRLQLRNIVFSDHSRRKALDAIMHPAIYQQIESELGSFQCGYYIIALPLLLETRHLASIDRILVVDCSEELQVLRVVKRDNVEPEQVRAIMAVQTSRQLRLQAADDVIENSGDESLLADRVKKLHQFYLALANLRTTPA